MMKLELKIFPLMLILIIGALMFLTSLFLPNSSAFPLIRYTVALLLVIVGVATVLSGALTFKSHETTVNPMSPESASRLVTTGIYRFSRNPMYVGFALILLAWMFVLASYISIFWIIVYVVYITQYQIKPEEKALQAKFKEEYQQYKLAVRRWL